MTEPWVDGEPWVDTLEWGADEDGSDVPVDPGGGGPVDPGTPPVVPSTYDSTDYQFDIAGVSFGRGLPLFVVDGSFDPGTAEWRTQDGEVAHGDGNTFGRDYISGPTWAWTIGVDRFDPQNALERVRRIKRAWQPTGSNRLAPSQVMRLDYRIAGRKRHVYGRPRNFATSLDNKILTGFAEITADFKCADHLTYDSSEQIVQTSLVADAAGGFRFPMKSPFRSVRLTTSERRGIGTVGDDADTWPIIEVKGPISGAVIECVGQ